MLPYYNVFSDAITYFQLRLILSLDCSTWINRVSVQLVHTPQSSSYVRHDTVILQLHMHSFSKATLQIINRNIRIEAPYYPNCNKK